MPLQVIKERKKIGNLSIYCDDTFPFYDIGFINPKPNHPKNQTVFPSSLCSAAVHITRLLDDPSVTLDGNSVYEVAYHVLWSCLVDDCSLFFRYVFEKLTRGQHELMFKV